MNNNESTRKEFKSPLGYSFYMENNAWREITEEERAQFNIDETKPTYLINNSLLAEFMVSLDGFYEQVPTKEFYNVCKKNMIDYGYKVLKEEVYNSVIGEKVEAYKLLAEHPEGNIQVSYFMRLTGKTPKGYGYGCLSAFPEKDRDTVENFIVEAINNWKYLDVND